MRAERQDRALSAHRVASRPFSWFNIREPGKRIKARTGPDTMTKRRLAIIIAFAALLLLIAAGLFILRWTPCGTPVLAYHAVEDVPFTESEHLFVTPRELEDQIIWLKRAGYSFAFADDPAAFTKEKQVVITFDDGYKDNLTEALPILQKHGACATVFVVTKNVGKNDNFLTEEDVKALKDSGLVHIGSHTDGHYLLTGLSDEDKEKQLSLSKKRLEEMTGEPVTAMSYPGGYTDDMTRRIALSHYDLCYTYPDTNWLVGKNYDPGAVNRITVSRGTSGLKLILMLKKARPLS